MTEKCEAIFAGGCFWCMQPPFDHQEGVLSTEVGYTGGDIPNPDYRQVSEGGSGHLEAIRVVYDPRQVSYSRLLQIFWRNIDPTQADGQFADRGSQYETAIFYKDEEQHRLAVQSKEELKQSGRFADPIATKILPAAPFYSAETEHQRFYQKNSRHYQQYKFGSGRAGFIERVWGDESADE
jgi:methionine-S-sulfoxide reductase